MFAETDIEVTDAGYEVAELDALSIELSNSGLKRYYLTAKLILGVVERLAIEEEGPEAAREGAKEDVTILRRHGISLSTEPDAGTEDGDDEVEQQDEDGDTA